MPPTPYAPMAMIYCPCPSADVAQSLARHLLEARLIACANILAPIESLYWWEGVLESTTEHPILLKTRTELVGEVFAQIQTHHPHETPAILHWNATTTQDFTKWLTECTKTVASDANMQ